MDLAGIDGNHVVFWFYNGDMVKTIITNEEGKELGAILSKRFMKKKVFCFLCGKAVSDSKQYNEAY